MAPSDEEAPGYNAERRAFFRTFGRQSVRSAGAVVGAAAELRRAGSEAARDLLALGPEPAPAALQIPVRPSSADITPAELPGLQFRSPYLVNSDGLTLLDQRALPARLETVAVRQASELASAIRAGVVNAGPVLADVCAFGLAEIARNESAGRAAQSFDQIFRAALDTLRGARPDVHALTVALDRMQARYESIVVGEGDVVSELRDEAEGIVGAATIAHAALARAGAAAVSSRATARGDPTPGAPINLLMHGDSGPLSCGVVGTGTALVQALTAAGRTVHVWVTRAEPSSEGARLTSFQLGQIDVPHTLIPDSAVGWLLGARSIDGVVLRADTVAANGDVAALLGARGVAQIAAASGVAVYALAPRSAFDEVATDLRALRELVRSEAEATFGASLNPRIDIVPRDLLTAYLTEDGAQPGGRS